MEERVDKGTDKLSCLEWLCHGISDDDLAPPCLNLPQRKLGDYYYCLDCLPITEYDLEQEAKHKKTKLDFSKKADPEAVAARMKQYEEADRRQQEWMKMQRAAKSAAVPGSLLDRLNQV